MQFCVCRVHKCGVCICVESVRHLRVSECKGRGSVCVALFQFASRMMVYADKKSNKRSLLPISFLNIIHMSHDNGHYEDGLLHNRECKNGYNSGLEVKNMLDIQSEQNRRLEEISGDEGESEYKRKGSMEREK